MTQEMDRDRADRMASTARSDVREAEAESRSAVQRARDAAESGRRQVPVMVRSAREQAEELADRMPEYVDRARESAMQTNKALQTMPDSTLRQMAVGSAGLAAGLYIAGAPRILVIAAAAPAFMAAGAMATRSGARSSTR